MLTLRELNDSFYCLKAILIFKVNVFNRLILLICHNLTTLLANLELLKLAHILLYELEEIGWLHHHSTLSLFHHTFVVIIVSKLVDDITVVDTCRYLVEMAIIDVAIGLIITVVFIIIYRWIVSQIGFGTDLHYL